MKSSLKTFFGICLLVILVIGLVIFLYIRWQEQNTPASTALSTNPVIEAYKQALPELAIKVQQEPKNTQALRDYAVALYATGDIEAAKGQYLAELKLNPTDPVLLNNLANAYRDTGGYQDAVNYYQKSIDADLKQTNAYSNLANLYIYTLNQKSLGYGVYLKAIANNPINKVGLLIELGNAYADNGNKAEAIETFTTVIKIDPNNTSAKLALTNLGN